MNTFAKLVVTTTLGFAALSAHAEDLTYPGPFAKSTLSSPAATGQESPYIFQGEFLVNNPKYRAPVAGRSVQEVRHEIMKAKSKIDATNVSA